MDPAQQLCVLLDEEYKFAIWYWYPGMTADELEACWRAVPAAPPGGVQPATRLRASQRQ